MHYRGLPVTFLVVNVVLIGPTGASILDRTPPARETVSFDFGWRFRLGEPGPACPDDAFPQNLSGRQCYGLRRGGTTDVRSCQGACCEDEECAVWQFSEQTVGGGCWIGTSTDCDHPNDGWVGGGRETPAPLPPVVAELAGKDYNDSSWEVVDTPHDAIISSSYSPNAGRSGGYLPLNVSWYRKHFHLPADWQGSAIFVYFEGVFRSSKVYLNGEFVSGHQSGYTSFVVRLDNQSSISFGDSGENVLAVRAEAAGGSGWWYEGGGIYRHVYLTKTSRVHIVADGVYFPGNITGGITPDVNTRGVLFASQCEFFPQVDVVNDGTTISTGVQVKFTIFDRNQQEVGHISGRASSEGITPGRSLRFSAKMVLKNVSLWTTRHPYLYRVSMVIFDSNGTVLDEVNTTTGVRMVEWDSYRGFYLNREQFVWRGFCNHNSFAGVGVAVPDRINLFRAQALRAVGGNSWRMSHNPPVPALLDILDRLGVLVWDENRNFGNNSDWLQCMRDMVRRDRNHPSVIIWSFCNEAGCMEVKGPEPGEVGKLFKAAVKEEDPWRAVGANMWGKINSLTDVIDVQGFSHEDGDMFDSFHAALPDKPVIGSECCSCETLRGVDIADGSRLNLSNFAGYCQRDQNDLELVRNYVAGTTVWTLFDYYGEPAGPWPMVSSSFGAIDLAGFAKASAYWYRAWWLSNRTQLHALEKKADVPHNAPNLVGDDTTSINDLPLPLGPPYLCHIMEHWETSVGGSLRTVRVLTDLPKVELFLNNRSLGTVGVMWFAWAEFENVTYVDGNLTATGMDYEGKVLATCSRHSTGVATALRLDVDVPSNFTGTGTALVPDGQDAALIRASIVDDEGRLVNSASPNITFEIVSGPGRIIGVGNGDPTCHEPNKATWRSAYHGLARAIVQVAENRVLSTRERIRLLQIDIDGDKRTRIVASDSPAPREIVVEAHSPELKSDRVSIELSSNSELDGVLAVAERWMKGN